ncbi:MAG TPA: hypothetical protein VFB10_13605 [Candidatus Dormibacteraeota bacterium]|nr:hypothetical protein [Candidatus Dormibacteraeota bacterium]
MKVRILGVVVLTVLILAVAFSVLTLAAPKASHANAAPAAAAAPANAPSPEEHPQIRDALHALRNAREHLEHAAHDFGGHRAEALRATDEAIHQLEICLKYDK